MENLLICADNGPFKMEAPKRGHFKLACVVVVVVVVVVVGGLGELLWKHLESYI